MIATVQKRAHATSGQKGAKKTHGSNTMLILTSPCDRPLVPYNTYLRYYFKREQASKQLHFAQQHSDAARALARNEPVVVETVVQHVCDVDFSESDEL